MIERRHFFGAAFVAMAERVVPAQDVSTGRAAVVARAGTDRRDQPFTFLDATFNVVLSGADTQGRCVIFDTLRHRKVGPALHVHTDCDEWFWIVGGQFKFQVGSSIVRLGPGDSLMAPRDVPHAFVSISDEPARLIVMHQPAATMEEYFRAMAALPNPSVEVRRAAAEQHGMRFVGSALTPD